MCVWNVSVVENMNFVSNNLNSNGGPIAAYQYHQKTILISGLKQVPNVQVCFPLLVKLWWFSWWQFALLVTLWWKSKDSVHSPFTLANICNVFHVWWFYVFIVWCALHATKLIELPAISYRVVTLSVLTHTACPCNSRLILTRRVPTEPQLVGPRSRLLWSREVIQIQRREVQSVGSVISPSQSTAARA